MEYCHNQTHPVQSSARNDHHMSGSMGNTAINGEQSFNSNQFYNSGQGVPAENQWSTTSSHGFQPPVNTASMNQTYPGNVNQFVPQFPYPANPPGQFMSPYDWMTQNTMMMPPPPPPPLFPPYNHMMPFTPTMGYPGNPFMSFGPSQPMPFPQVKMEPDSMMDPTGGYYNMVPRNGQAGSMTDSAQGYYNMVPRNTQGWNDSPMHGPNQQNYTNYSQGNQGYSTSVQTSLGAQTQSTVLSNNLGTQGQPVANTNQGAQVHPTVVTNGDSIGQSKEKPEQINASHVENIVNTRNQIDIPDLSGVTKTKTSSNCPKNATPTSTINSSVPDVIPKTSSGTVDQSYEETGTRVSFSSKSELKENYLNSNSGSDSSNQNNWYSKLESSRLRMSFSPYTRADLPCDSCSQWKPKSSLESSQTPSSDDDVVIVPGKLVSVHIRHILCEKCGAVGESEGVTRSEKWLPPYDCKTSKCSTSNSKDTIAQRKDKHSDSLKDSPLSQKFLLFSKVGSNLETFEIIKEDNSNCVSTLEDHDLTVYNLGTLADLQTGTPGKASRLLDCQSKGIAPKIFDLSGEEKYNFLQTEVSSFTGGSDSSGHHVTFTPDISREIGIKGIVSMEHKSNKLKSGKSSVSSSLPAAKKTRVCWSCQTQQSKGAWHGHKFQENNFLCGECFELHKKSNARRKEVSAETQKDKEKVISSDQIFITEKLPKKTKVVTNHNEDEFYLSSPVQERNKKPVSHSKVEKKSTRFTRQWAKSQLEKEYMKGDKGDKKCRSKCVVNLSKDRYDDIARALRKMGEGGESDEAST